MVGENFGENSLVRIWRGKFWRKLRGESPRDPFTLSHMAMPSRFEFSVSLMVRGYHVYQDEWEAVLGEVLSCQREPGNRHDPYAVAAVSSGRTVGHVPRKISPICSIFIHRGGLITCTVTGSRRYSTDLEQGGLEIPCLLKFSSSSFKEKEKAEFQDFWRGNFWRIYRIRQIRQNFPPPKFCTVRYSSHSESLMPNCRDASFTAYK